MKIWVHIYFVVLTTALGRCLAYSTPLENDIQNGKINSELKDVEPAGSEIRSRFKRQDSTTTTSSTTTTTTTTPKPKKNRPSNLFSLISVLISETREDTNRAFNEIGTLFNSQFTNETTTTPKQNQTTTTTSGPSTSGSDEDNEVTTTTESFRISRDEFFGILRSNVQGIRQLLNKEFRIAIQDSNQNVREFGRELGTALRPYFT